MFIQEKKNVIVHPMVNWQSFETFKVEKKPPVCSYFSAKYEKKKEKLGKLSNRSILKLPLIPSQGQK